MINNFCADGSCEKCSIKVCKRRKNYKSGQYKILADFGYIPETAKGVFVDIGTTTIAAVRFLNGTATACDTRSNPQYKLGADVISRITAEAFGKHDELVFLLREAVRESIEAVGEKDDICYISANTAMVNMYLGNNCRSLGVYPFNAPSLDAYVTDKMIILPCISGFIGADVASGLFMCGFHESDEMNIFIDLGTNTEIAIGNKNRIMVTSAAGGTAFEGGGISCGVGSVEGAICSVSQDNESFRTINDKSPVGICGTGIVDLLAKLLKTGVIDRTGRLKDDKPYRLTDKIEFNQSDIREIQTAKSAVRAGIELLIDNYGVDETDIKNIFIAGGFGKWLDINNACSIGLLPKRFMGKYRAVGNSSLGGIVKLSETPNGMEQIEDIKKACAEISLAEAEKFSQLFLKYMNFEEE